MTNNIRKELVFPLPSDTVWRALTDKDALAAWMGPHSFEPLVGHQFTFQLPPDPKVGFDGVVRCVVLACLESRLLAHSWSAGPVVNTRVSYRLASDGAGTRLSFEHAGFDMSQSWSQPAFQAAGSSWTRSLNLLSALMTK
jgi:uncharacterized protein YndB with AHSA1/START domain